MFNLLNKQYKTDIILLETQIKALKAEIDRLNDDFKRFKGYVYNKKIHIDQEESNKPEVIIPYAI